MNGSPFALISESFSGVLALRIARDYPNRVTAVILANSFVVSPRSAFFRLLPWRAIFSISPPEWVLRHFFLGPAVSAKTVSALRAAIAETSPGVLAARVRAVVSLHESELLVQASSPILYLRGTADRLVPAKVSQRMQRLRSDIMIKDIAAPHLLLQVAPHEAWREIGKFISQVRAA